jgi:hypothetical protein
LEGRGGLEFPGLQLVLHERPAVLNQVEIRRVVRPVKNFELALHLLQPLHDVLAGVAGGAVLEEEYGPMDPHKRKQVILQNGLLALIVHHTVFGQEVKASSASFSAEITPHHHSGTVLHGGDGVPLFEERDAPGSSDLGPPGVDQAESGLI